MTYRVTDKHLEAKADNLNALTGNAKAPWSRTDPADDRTMQANIGNYHISHAYGGVSLHQMQTDGGGVRDVFNQGHMPKRELAGLMDAYMAGWRDCAERARRLGDKCND